MKPPRRVIVGPLVNTVAGQDVAKKGFGKHLQPGVVAYDQEDGSTITYLLTLEAIERMRPTAKDKPIVGKSGNFKHLKIEQGKKYDGKATDGVWDGESGWEGINFYVDNAETADACRKGFEFSCAYVPTEVDKTPGRWHNVPYDAVIVDGEYTHFAVVPNPRYEGAEIQLENSLKSNGGIVNKALKAVLSVLPIAQLREIINSIEKDEKRNAALATAKSAYDEAMKNAKTDEEKAKAKEDFEKANAAAGADSETPEEKAAREKKEKVQALRNEADALEKGDGKPPLGGGDVPPEPGVPGQQVPAKPAANAEETPEQKAEKEAAAKLALERKNAEDEAAANLAKEAAEKDRLEGEKKNALEKEMGAAWDRFTADMVDEGAAKKVLVNAADKKIKPYADQPAEVRAAWAAAYAGAAGAKPEEKLNSLGKKATEAVELRNAMAKKAADDAKREAARTQNFNSLREAAALRGGSAGIPQVGVVSVQEKEDLGRDRYGSGQ